MSESTNQCRAVVAIECTDETCEVQNKKKCTRKPYKDGYCKQHYTLIQFTLAEQYRNSFERVQKEKEAISDAYENLKKQYVETEAKAVANQQEVLRLRSLLAETEKFISSFNEYKKKIKEFLTAVEKTHSKPVKLKSIFHTNLYWISLSQYTHLMSMIDVSKIFFEQNKQLIENDDGMKRNE